MNDELFEEDLNKKKKRIGKNKPAMGWLTALGIIVAGFVLMATPIFLFSSLPEPHWGNTVDVSPTCQQTAYCSRIAHW